MRLRLRIGDLMREEGISIKELAEKADIAPNTARGFYHGITIRVDLPLLDRVAQALGVPPLELFEQVPDDEA
jgi:putative transcriptional regulator